LVLIVYIKDILACVCTWFLVLACSVGMPELSWPIEGFCFPHNRGWCEALAPEAGLGCAYPTGQEGILPCTSKLKLGVTEIGRGWNGAPPETSRFGLRYLLLSWNVAVPI
jgi:hypothetical protein